MGYFSSPPRQDGLWAQSPSYPVGNRGSYFGSKAAGTWSWPLTSIYCRDTECVEPYLHFSNMPSWCGAQIRKSRGATLPL